MTRAALSVFVFSVYLYVLGFVLVVAPNALLGLFRIPDTDEVWVRVVGMLVAIIGYYYSTAARAELTPMFRASAFARLSVLVFFVAFVLLGFAPPVLIVFGLIDAVCAVWTLAALRAGGDRPADARV